MATMHAGHETELIRSDIEGFLRQYEQKELLRFVAVGSVDDGKSTLIGRLLHDTQGIYEDQLSAVKRASVNRGVGEIDFSLFTDGLKAEREQGITIDVAYRYFNTEKRKFIIADTPGHIQYTRNMVTGASTANVGIILVDARLGVLQQSRRHATLASMLGIPHLLVAINKMDLVGYDQGVYDRIREDFGEFSTSLGFKDITFVPISALKGDNVVEASSNTSWYEGTSVLEYLETVPIFEDQNFENFRYPVQTVLRPDLNYRGFAGRIASGIVKKGDEILVLPSGKTSKVKAIDTWEGELEEAAAPRSVTIRLDDEIDCSRGDMLVLPGDRPRIGRSFSAKLVWMHETPLDLQKTYLLKHTSQMIRAQVDGIEWKLNMDTLAHDPAGGLELNDIGQVKVTCHRALYYDDYRKNRQTGAFVLVDSLTNNTVAAGMIEDAAGTASQDLDAALRELRAGSGLRFRTQVSPLERRERMGQSGTTIWLTGLPGSGRWALAYALERKLFDAGHTATVITPVGRDRNSMVSAAKAATDAGLVTICAYRAYSEADRLAVREALGEDSFVEVFVNTDDALCRERRPDADFDGFEEPSKPDLTVALDHVRLDEATKFVIDELTKRGQFD